MPRPPARFVPKQEYNPYWSTSDGETVRLYLGNVIEALRQLPAKSVQMVVTSPPYWNLRDYGTGEWEGGDPGCDHIERTAEEAHRSSTLGSAGTGHPVTNAAYQATIRQFAGQCGKCGAVRKDEQLGSEDIPDCLGWASKRPCGHCFVCHMVLVFREVRRVLRSDGTCWLNLGDTYATADNPPSGNLVGVPWRVALALQVDGWILRQDIIWAKPGPMPESVQNRCTKAHEYMFLLSTEEQYYYDMEAYKEPVVGDPETIKKGVIAAQKKKAEGRGRAGMEEAKGMVANTDGWRLTKEPYAPTSKNKRSVWTIDDEQALVRWLAINHPRALAEYLRQSDNTSFEYCFLLSAKEKYFYDAEAIKDETIGEWMTGFTKQRPKAKDLTVEQLDKQRTQFGGVHTYHKDYLQRGRNKRSVWTISSQGYEGAHFACVDEETEALTRSGWKRHQDIKDGECIAAYSQYLDRLVWQPATIHCYEYDGKLVTLDKRDTSQHLTPDHRCFVKSRKGILKIKQAHKVKPRDQLLMTAEFSEEPLLSIGTDMAALVGWYASEGYKGSKKWPAQISQSLSANPQHVETIRNLLCSLEALFRIKWRDRGERGQEAVFKIGGWIGLELVELCPDKCITDQLTMLPNEELESLLSAFISGDGHSRLDGRQCIIQKDKLHIERLQVIAIKLGYRAHIAQRFDGVHVLYLTKGRWLLACGSGGKNVRCQIDYKGLVWCPHVETGLWLARRNGKPFITGNTFPVKLVEPCVLAGTSEKGACPVCGAPWERVIEKEKLTRSRPNEYVKRTGEEGTGNSCANTVAGVETKTLGWRPSCECSAIPIIPDQPQKLGKREGESEKDYVARLDHDWVPQMERWWCMWENVKPQYDKLEVRPCIVLDPFMGSGTTAVVAIEHGRWAWGIDLSEDYINNNAVPRIEGALLSRPAMVHLAGREVKPVSIGRSAIK